MRPRRDIVFSDKDLEPDWYKRVLILWQEDDAKPPGRELPGAAFIRISGDKQEKRVISKCDLGDINYTLHAGGWVKIGSYEGGAVGVLLKPLVAAT